MSHTTDSLIVFARAPRPGTVKTRLARTLGEVAALAIYRELAEHTLHVARAAGIPVHVAFTPPDAAREMRRWLGDDVAYEAQADGDLGARMAHSIGARIAAGSRRVVIVGTDCPALTPAILCTALDALDHADVVFGPASDGGYYLMAQRALHPPLFHDVPWSSAQTLAVSLARAQSAGLHVALLEELRDVDTAEDWQAYRNGGA